MGLHNGLYDGLDNGLHNGLYNNDIGSNPLLVDLSCYYKLNNDSLKSYGTNDGTDVNGVTYSNVGSIKNSATYDGINDYTTIIANSDFNFGSKNFGVSLWFKKKENNRRQELIGQGNNAGHNETIPFFIGFDSSNILRGYVFYNSGLDVFSLVSTVSVTDSALHHVCLTRDKDNFYLFLDNKLISSVDHNFSGATVVSSSNNMSIGRLGEFNNFYFNGNIYEVGIWKQSILPYTNKLFNRGVPLSYPFFNKI